MTSPRTLSAFPIGAIVAFGGDLSNTATLAELTQQGWYLCDGASFDKTRFAALFAAIGTANGGGGNNFNLPDLRNRFMRGTLRDGVAVDPDAGARAAAASGGAVGNHTGSLQKYATALSLTSPWTLQQAGRHTHTCLHLNAEMHMTWRGQTVLMARWNATAKVDAHGAHKHELIGFDATTVPINVALHFIIKADEQTAPAGDVPAGAIIGYAGAVLAPPPPWLQCNGAAYGIGVYPRMANRLRHNYGGDDKTTLNVPDLRGYFLRGSSHASRRDPDAGTRHPLHLGGNAGDAVGSAQLYATGLPSALAVASAGEHWHSIELVPQTDFSAAKAAGPAAFNCMVWTENATISSQNGDHNHRITGGDKESRPENVYVDFLVASDDLAQAAPPIGAIMSFGGDITDPGVVKALSASGWLPCDGGALRISDFGQLYAVIGKAFGSAPLKFNMPDLRGHFVVGAGNVVPGITRAISITGAPAVPFITTIDGEHQHTLSNIPTETHMVDSAAGVKLAWNNPNKTATSSDGAHTHALSGGDKESRPVNVNVDYIIRFR